MISVFIHSTCLLIPTLLTFFFVIQPLHELGHWIVGVFYEYRPCAMQFKLWIFPGAVLFLTDIRKTNKIFKLSGLLFPILIIPLWLEFLKVVNFPFYKSSAYWWAYVFIVILSASFDLELVLKDIFGEETTIPILNWFRRGDEGLTSCALVIKREIWEEWKEKYPKDYENAVDKEIFFPKA